MKLEFDVRFEKRKAGRKALAVGVSSAPPPYRIPRVARFMALAIRWQQLLAEGTLKDYAQIARLGFVTRARITHIMNLLQLAPDLQETLLFLPPVTRGKDPLILRQLQPIAGQLDWTQQRQLWAKIQLESPN